MTISERDIIELLCTLAEEERLVVTLSESLKGGLIAGAGTIIGGVLLGPIGLAAGGIVGGCLAAYLGGGKFLPAVEVISTMQPDRRSRLIDKVRTIMSSVDSTDAAMFAAMLTCDLVVRKRVLGILIDHFKTEMYMSITERT